MPAKVTAHLGLICLLEIHTFIPQPGNRCRGVRGNLPPGKCLGMIPAYSGTCIDVYSAVNCPVVIRLMLGADNCSVCDLI